ncbi:hypothetical protein, partial [Serratia marcescens]|uniref:hypothetical protein n=1 Tax=Serratia marcescens TaxID=615 RepID=UPI002FD981C6
NRGSVLSHSALQHPRQARVQIRIIIKVGVEYTRIILLLKLHHTINHQSGSRIKRAFMAAWRQRGRKKARYVCKVNDLA